MPPKSLANIFNSKTSCLKYIVFICIIKNTTCLVKGNSDGSDMASSWVWCTDTKYCEGQSGTDAIYGPQSAIAADAISTDCFNTSQNPDWVLFICPSSYVRSFFIVRHKFQVDFGTTSIFMANHVPPVPSAAVLQGTNFPPPTSICTSVSYTTHNTTACPRANEIPRRSTRAIAATET